MSRTSSRNSRSTAPDCDSRALKSSSRARSSLRSAASESSCDAVVAICVRRFLVDRVVHPPRCRRCAGRPRGLHGGLQRFVGAAQLDHVGVLVGVALAQGLQFAAQASQHAAAVVVVQLRASFGLERGHLAPHAAHVGVLLTVQRPAER